MRGAWGKSRHNARAPCPARVGFIETIRQYVPPVAVRCPADAPYCPPLREYRGNRERNPTGPVWSDLVRLRESNRRSWTDSDRFTLGKRSFSVLFGPDAAPDAPKHGHSGGSIDTGRCPRIASQPEETGSVAGPKSVILCRLAPGPGRQGATRSPVGAPRSPDRHG